MNIIPKIDLGQKEVNFEIFASSDYSAPQWEDVKVQVSVGIARIHEGGEQTVELDSTLAWIRLRELPPADNSISILYTVKDVRKGKEQLSISYQYRIDQKGMLSYNARNFYMEDSQTSQNVDISL
ncbi:MAG: hypothetical protein ACLFUB_21875 [Cyclobacteriaceae bacterium]